MQGGLGLPTGLYTKGLYTVPSSTQLGQRCTLWSCWKYAGCVYIGTITGVFGSALGADLLTCTVGGITQHGKLSHPWSCSTPLRSSSGRFWLHSCDLYWMWAGT